MPLVAPRRLSPADAYPLSGGVPYRLHTREIVGAESVEAIPDTLGTLAFSHQFFLRLEQALRAELWEDHLKPHEWYRSPYVVARLMAAFGKPIIRAVYARLRAARDLEADETFQAMDDWREYRPYREAKLAEAIEPFGYTGWQVERAERQIMRLVGGKLIAYRPELFHRPEWERQTA